MESHIMNVPYHQPRYRTIGHKIMRTTSNSISSESSCNQNSPEYKAQQAEFNRSHFEEESNEAQEWEQNQTESINVTQSSQDLTSDEEDVEEEEEEERDEEEEAVEDDIEEAVKDEVESVEENNDEVEEESDEIEDKLEEEVEEEQIEVEQVQYEVRDTVYEQYLSEAENIEEHSLVEGTDYDIIQVYAVDPNLALAEDEDQEDFCIDNNVVTEVKEVKDEKEEEDIAIEEEAQCGPDNYENKPSDILHDGLNIDLDTPVVSNVDEYFIKHDTKDILKCKDEPVVQDVDEYFIKDGNTAKSPSPQPRIPNVDDFFIKHKVPEEASTSFRIDKPVSKLNEIFPANEAEKLPRNNERSDDVAINESDLEVLPNIEELKRFLMEDSPCTKFRHAQRSCSLPHSPINICLDIDDAKTCLSFEDLNLDLSDLAFDNDKDKSDSIANKSDDIPRTLTEEDVNSFLITSKPEPKAEVKDEDDLSSQDMEIERPVESSINTIHEPPIDIPRMNSNRTSTPIPQPTVLDFCVEKTNPAVKIKKEVVTDVKTELDDFIDVESCNDTVVPVLEAYNLSSLLEQFEATEKLNKKSKKAVIKAEEPKVKNASKNSLTNGMRLQDAAVQLNKNKMRQILMPSTINATVRRSPSPVHSDHDYCTSKKRHSLPNLKGGQSLLKPEVLSSNSRILNSRHRSCKNKKIVYNLSSDDESEKCNNNNNKNKKNVNNRDDSDVKFKKFTIKQPVKPPAQSTCRKKLSPTHSAPNDISKNVSVINKSAPKASDNPISQNSNGSIKLTIKNKSEVILSCDHKDSHKNKHSEKSKSSVVSDKSSDSDKTSNNAKDVKSKPVKEVIKDIKTVEISKSKTVHSKEPVKEIVVSSVSVKEEPRTKDDNFYTALFANKQDVLIPVAMVKTEKRPFDEELQRISDITIKKETEQPLKKKKLNLQEYKMRIVNSNNSSTAVSPEAIFPDIPHLNLEKTLKVTTTLIPNGSQQAKSQENPEPKKIFDPIREASRKIIMNNQKQKAMRKRDEDIVMSKIPKVENLQLQPLISDAEMMKIVGMTTAEELPVPVAPERPQASADYEEIILVSVGVNTDAKVLKKMNTENEKRKSKSPQADAKSLINFTIKKSDHVLKQNVFEPTKRDKRSPVEDKKHVDSRIDKERYKGITAALKSVEKNVHTKISGNSLFASIQDVVMKKAPEDGTKANAKTTKSNSFTEKRDVYKYIKTVIVREYDAKADHGEDKVILHLGKNRTKPTFSTIVVQTDALPEFCELSAPTMKVVVNSNVRKEVLVNRKRNDSDMSMSSEGSPVRKGKVIRVVEKKTTSKLKEKEVRAEKRSMSKEKRSRSKDRYEVKYRRRSRSHSRSRRRRRSRSRSRSRSRGRYRRYRRSDSPYRRKRRSRSPYRRRSPTPRRSPSGRRSTNDRHSPVNRRSPTPRRDHRRSRSRSRHTEPHRSKSPMLKKVKLSPQNSVEKMNGNDKKPKSMTPPLRKLTVSESSDSSTSSSSSSSSSSDDSVASGRSCSTYERDDSYRKNYRSYSSEDRESNTPVEERRIVFVGKLEKEATKSSLRGLFSKFGSVMEVRLHCKEDGTRYGFVTYKRARDAWTAVESAGVFPQYDVGFGGRRAFCRQSYADLDGLEAKYTEIAFHGQAALPARRTDDMSFEQMLQEMRRKLSQRKGDKSQAKHEDKP